MNPNQIVAGPGGEDLSHCLSARDMKGPCSNLAQGTLVCHGTQDPLVSENAFPLGTNSGQENAVFGIPGNWVGRKPENGGNQVEPCHNEAPCLTKTDRHAVAFQSRYARNGRGAPDDVAPPVMAQAGKTGKGDGATCVLENSHVRRLTPVECERLQGFKDNYTLIPGQKMKKIEHDYHEYLKRHAPGLSDDEMLRLAKDGPRYEALGNSMPVPVMHWIGQRIDLVNNLLMETA